MSVTSIRPSPDAESITRAVRGFADVRDFHLAFDPKTSRYSLRLTLANAEGKIQVLLCSDVQNLELNATGEGFEQLPLLRIEDVRADKLDRIHYTVDELETEALFLHCAGIELVAQPCRRPRVTLPSTPCVGSPSPS